MGYNIRKNWIESAGLMVKRPIVILPFFIITFLEGLALEIIYFSPRKPLLNIAGPIIRKFFREAFLHYPENLAIMPNLFYYAQVVIYVFFGAFLTAICVAIVRNLKMDIVLKADALIKNTFKRYLSLFVFAVIIIALVFLLKKVDTFIFAQFMGLTGKHLPQIILRLSPFILTLVMFLSNLILQTFLILTIPLIIIKKKSLLRALGGSIAQGLLNFWSIFMLIFLPSLIYFPITLLKTAAPKLIDKTFPEIILGIIVVGMLLSAFVECFIIVCASQFVLDKDK